jgi:transposase
MAASHASAVRAIRQRRWGSRTLCPRCLDAGWRLPRAWPLATGRWRCRRCRYTFGVTTGTWAGLMRVAPATWLWLVKLFELELTASQAAVQLGVSYPTALRAFTLIRRAVLAGEGSQEALALLRREVEADESYFGPRRPKRGRGRKQGRGAPHKTPVFGILERRGEVRVEVVRDCSAATIRDHTLRWVKRGTLVYSDRWRGYDALAFCGYRHLRVDHQRHFSRGKVHINGLEGFWSYAKTKFIKHHGVSPARFPLYLFEWQFRYNHRRENLFELLLKATLKSVPNPL